MGQHKGDWQEESIGAQGDLKQRETEDDWHGQKHGQPCEFGRQTPLGQAALQGVCSSSKWVPPSEVPLKLVGEAEGTSAQVHAMGTPRPSELPIV